ncbi:GH36-type glycosyl hydrolase domain-containing protein [Ferruginibacter sp.]
MKRNAKKNDNTIFEILPHAVSALKKTVIAPFFGEDSSTRYLNERPPLRSELYTEEQLKQHAKTISKRHGLISGSPSELLLKRLSENEKILVEVHAVLTAAVNRNERIVPAAEWLLDNFYLIEEQIYIGKKHLPKGYSKGLPQLAKGESAGLPRVYDIAVEIISHSDGHIDLNNLTGFIMSYQTTTFLKIGELWAFPIMLRLALIENLRRLSIQISADISNKTLADEWADKLISSAENDPKNLVLVIADMARSEPPMVSSFVAELARRLQEKGSSLSLPINWIEQQLSEHGLTSEELIQQENQKQAADQVSISNSISSLRFLGSTDWREFVENTSIVEQILREDVNAVYAGMDFHTRDQYRHAVEKIAKYSTLTEQQVAAMAIEAAKESAAKEDDPRRSHVGYYLTGKGLLKMQRQAKMKPSQMETCRKITNRFPLFFYLGGIFLITALSAWGLFAKAHVDGTTGWKLISLLLVAAVACSQPALNIVNWLVTLFARPAVLPKMDFSKGIPDEYRTMVVIPTLLSSATGIADLIENLEVRFLANRDANLCFALLTDFKDAEHQYLPEDKTLLQTVKNKIIELNKKYGRSSNDTFFLFHRPRKLNKKEKAWIGHERKRGKLSELNKLILGRDGHDFITIIGDENIYTAVKFIITLDTDTQLPRDAAWKMVGTLAHPLNRAVFSAKKRRVTEGYTILQPRVSNSLPADNSSVYAKIHGNEPGTDPYTRAVSDVYQDLFGEGSFIGKGIYDIAAFEQVLDNSFPENRILSHDLVEGCYARSGLITDVQLYEEYPTQYTADMQRRHRWIRGDWQIASWMFPWVRTATRRMRRNPISLLSRWKIFDNVRRSLVPLSYLLLLIFGWSLAASPWFFTLSVLLLILMPAVIGFVWELCNKPADVIFSQHFIFTYRTAKDRFIQLLIEIATLPYEVYLNVHAIVITLWRMLISGNKLLQWNPYNSQQKQRTVIDFYRKMWIAPVFASALFIYISMYQPVILVFAYPFLGLWALSPALMWLASRPGEYKMEAMTAGQTIYLRRLARKTWAFFETFVTAEDNWLPPDNYQEHPVERIAHRTSPTNIGMALLANLTAHDFGYVTTTKLVERTSNTIDTIQRLEKYRGHLYNWYDTVSLVPLAPRYISTVDSGNMAGHLLTLKQGLLSLADVKIMDAVFFEGLADAIGIVTEKNIPADALISFKKYVKDIKEKYPEVIDNLPVAKAYVDNIRSSFEHLLVMASIDEESEAWWWAQKALTQLKEAGDEIMALCPWLALPAAPGKFSALIPSLPSIPTLKQLSRIEEILLHKIIEADAEDNSVEETAWLNDFRHMITESGRRAKEMIITIEQLAIRCGELSVIDYDFLYYRAQHLLTIGYNVDEHRKDNGYYDLLASEARLATFVAIAQGKLPQESWFALGRQLTKVGATPVLLSWSGSMFEYLMPLLVMPTYENTLLNQTYRAIIQKQIEYGKKRGVPWGISESGYNMVDANLNYQYKAFGVPGTGFKRGLGEDLVIAPYATVMALMVNATDAYDNLQVLKAAGFEGKYGFYEAVDYTNARLQRKQPFNIIRSFMVHHQGMSFLSLAYLLLNRPMQQRFAADIQVKSALLLLQERIPRVSTFYSPALHAGDTGAGGGGDMAMRVITTPHTPIPEVQLLSNGRYHVMVTNSGGGYTKWKNIAVTRWREDATCDNWGTFCYIRDLDSDVYWSAAFQPSLQQGSNYEAVFLQGRAEFRRSDLALETHTEIVVSPEDDIELRRIHITNRSRKRRTIEITSYAEVVLVPPLAEEMHPAFSNLFVETTIDEKHHAIICTRRPRAAEEQVPWMFHLMKVNDVEVKSLSYETDRSKFIGRGHTIHKPKVMSGDAPLPGNQGAVLDPIVAMRYCIVIEPHASATIDVIMGIAETKDQCNILVDKYQDQHLTNRVLELAWTHSQVILRQINATEHDAQLYARLAGSIIFANDSLRTDHTVMIKNQRGQSGLWGYSISGDLPIVLLQVEDSANIELVKQLIQAHTYWRMKGLMVDLVIWNEDHGGYRQALQNQILSLLVPGTAADVKDQPGGIFIRSSDQISNEDRILFQTVARVVISDRLGTLEEQLTRRNKLKTTIPYFSPSKFYPSIYTTVDIPTGLQFFNGTGGFSGDGKEYVITTTPEQSTPAPWSNVLANPDFGSIITESGQSYTWIDNAHEFRLTPWSNDPVTDLKGEAFYLRDEESGKFWSPAPLPCRGTSPYITRHGFGYSIFEHSEDGISSNMTIYTDIESPVKFIVIKLLNTSQRLRKLSVTGYVEWILGDLKARTQMHVVTDLDIRSGAILASNAYNTEFDNRVAFFDADDVNKTITADRTEFIGRNGTVANPDGLNRARLSGRTGAGLDPCAAIQIAVELAEDQEKQVVFRLGAGKNIHDTLNIIRRFEGSAAAGEALQRVQDFWQKALSAVQVATPDPSINILMNGWLNYQTLASRIWARSGFYQSGGAFGYRDQLQDVLSLIHSQPSLVKEQIILCASRQFKEGDVQHWWHPPMGRGVRTTCSDDFLWLPYVTSRYVVATGDHSILDIPVNFLEGRLLNAGEESYYDLPIRSDKQATVYEHCVRAIEHGLDFGEHGLPLIGSGDWNDGMDKVGHHGKGESVWLAFFLYDIIMKFIDIATLKNDQFFIGKCREAATTLRSNIQTHAWDGEWYRRAYFDDGTPLGSKENEECKIDSIAQSWSVISGAGTPEYQAMAMNAAEKYLVKKEDGILQLFDPPFNRSAVYPGYIKGYVPGVRENGGQYTHAAVWLIMAYAIMGDNRRTWELLQIVNPLNHGRDAASIDKYKTEPYVIAADVYAEPLHKGQGGWTWYTGSAGWMYQLLCESFIGLQRRGERLYFAPCVPKEWDTLKVQYRYISTLYNIELLLNQDNNTHIVVNGHDIGDDFITLVDDGFTHEVKVTVGIIQNLNQPGNVKKISVLS